MACNCTADEIEVKILTALRVALKNKTLTTASRFGNGREIDIDENSKRGLLFTVKTAVDDPDGKGCEIRRFTPDDMVRCKTIGDIVDAVVKELECEK